MFPPISFVAATIAAPLIAGSSIVAGGFLLGTAARQGRSRRFSITPRAPSFPEIEGLEELRSRLGLDIAQKTAWHKLELATWEIVGAEQACKQRHCEETIATLEQEDIDVAALQIVWDRYFDEKRAYAAEKVKGWQSFFNELNATQKAIARDFLRVRLRQLLNGAENAAQTKR